MGQQESVQLVDEDTPPQRLKKRDIESVAKYINDGKAKRIVVMAGAGISTSAGIPDFRSPDTGLYAQLAHLDLPYPEAVFDISFFRQNPAPFYALAHELYPHKFRPTVTHSFIRLLHDKGLLLKLFTQNIDCLERDAGLPDDVIVEAHGSFSRHKCIECGAPFPNERMEAAVVAKEIPRCVRGAAECGGLVKPAIVFFGEQLPDTFHLNRTLPAAADLCIIMGTSLSVQPFASLPGFCAEGVPRVLINSDRVGTLGSRPDDVLILGDCDTGVRKLAAALGWLEELEALWAQTQPAQSAEDTVAEAEAEAPPKSKDEQLSEDVARLTAEVDQALKVSNTYETTVRNQLKINGDHERTTEASTQPSVGELDRGPRATSLESPESMERKDEILRPNED